MSLGKIERHPEKYTMALTTGSAPKTWSSGITFMLAAVGAAVGLGNIWKFPYVAGVSGGGAFVLVYIACVIFVAIPVLISELLSGRCGRGGAVEPRRAADRAAAPGASAGAGCGPAAAGRV